MSLDLFGLTDTGCVREGNEDCILTDTALGLFLVCDGMGGHQHGEIASELATGAIQSYITASRDRDVSWPFGYNFELSPDSNRLVTAIQLANRQVWRRSEQSFEFAGMGTTIAAVLLAEDAAIVANVGDSRVYRLRHGELEQITVDDTMIDTLLRRGLIKPGDVEKHPMRNVLTQSAGSQEPVEVHIREEPLQHNDILLLCSDGLYGPVKDNEIHSILSSGEKAERCAKRLIMAARGAGGPDNISAVVLRYSE